MPVCDICGNRISTVADITKSFILTTTEVVENKAYWKFVFSKPEWLSDKSSTLIPYLVVKQTSLETGWWVCQNCSSHYTFNAPEAQQRIIDWSKNPNMVFGSSKNPANASAVALQAWEETHDGKNQ